MINEWFDYDPSYPYGADLDYLWIEEYEWYDDDDEYYSENDY